VVKAGQCRCNQDECGSGDTATLEVRLKACLTHVKSWNRRYDAEHPGREHQVVGRGFQQGAQRLRALALRGVREFCGHLLPGQRSSSKSSEGLPPAEAQDSDFASPANGALRIFGAECLRGIVHHSDSVGLRECSDFCHGLGDPEEIAHHDCSGTLQGKFSEPLGVYTTASIDIDESHSQAGRDRRRGDRVAGISGDDHFIPPALGRKAAQGHAQRLSTRSIEIDALAPEPGSELATHIFGDVGGRPLAARQATVWAAQ
jgi:hypothetical protein